MKSRIALSVTATVTVAVGLVVSPLSRAEDSGRDSAPISIESAAPAESAPSPAMPSGGTSTRRVEYRSDSGRTDSILPRLNFEAGIGLSALDQGTTYVRGDYRLKTGFMGSLTADIGRGSFVVETGLGYRKLGVIGDEDWAFNSSTSRADVDYLTVPVFAKWYTSGVGGRGFFLRGGLVPAFAVGGTDAVTRTQEDFFSGNVTESTIGLRTFDVLVSTGVGGAIPMSSNSALLLAADITRGIVDLDPSSDRDAHNGAFTFTAGLAFTL